MSLSSAANRIRRPWSCSRWRTGPIFCGLRSRQARRGLAKNEHETSFIEMIRRAADGEFPIREQIDSVIDRIRTDAASVALLTGTESVLKQWNSGTATPRIAAQLEIKEDAVQQRLRSTTQT